MARESEVKESHQKKQCLPVMRTGGIHSFQAEAARLAYLQQLREQNKKCTQATLEEFTYLLNQFGP